MIAIEQTYRKAQAGYNRDVPAVILRSLIELLVYTATEAAEITPALTWLLFDMACMARVAVLVSAHYDSESLNNYVMSIYAELESLHRPFLEPDIDPKLLVRNAYHYAQRALNLIGVINDYELKKAQWENRAQEVYA